MWPSSFETPRGLGRRDVVASLEDMGATIRMHGEEFMERWLRRIRGAIGMGLTWGAAWLGAGLALLVVVGPNAADVPFPLFFGLLGFIAGVTFSGILAIVERRRSLDQISLPRIAVWGGVGGLLLAGAMATGLGAESLAVLGPIFALSGASCAAGSLALARRAQARGSLDAVAALDDAGLTESEARELLGGGTDRSGRRPDQR